MSRWTRAIGILVVLFARISPAAEPLGGRALHDKVLRDGSLIQREGIWHLDWTPDGKGYQVFEGGKFQRVDVLTGEKTPLFDEAKIIAAYNAAAGQQATALPFQRFTFLDDGRKIRFEALRKTFIYDTASGEMKSHEPERGFQGVRGHSYEPVFSPDYKLRAFVRDYDLYVEDAAGNETALTTGGHEDLRNGFPDWVYPEELDQYDAFWWSPDSARIAYMQFDESPVAKYPLVHDVRPAPELELQSYPKAGANNPIVRFFIVEVATGKTVRVDTGMETNVYLFRGAWTPDGKEFTYLRLNRLQNAVELLAADPISGATRVVLQDEDPCYIDESVDTLFLRDSKHILWLSERSGWKEIYLHDLGGKPVRQLTRAKLPVDKVLGVDEGAGWVYFTGFETRGTESHLYRVKLDGTGFSRLTWESGQHRVSLSPGFHFYTDSFSSFEEPGRISLHQADGTEVRILGRSKITQALKELNLVKPEHFTFKSADGKHDLDGVLYKPAGFDENEKYPLILSVYGGPGSKMVSNSFRHRDHDQALAQLGFLVAIVDHRGCSGRGKTFQNLMYLNLGQVELEDHVSAVKHLATRPYVDATRVGISGHSYGGYLTCMALLGAPDVFHVGVAGAPVTDWRNYDSIYTERYMRRPQDNPEGYEKGSAVAHAKNLKGRLSIHHGAVDDNVHPGNAVQLLEALLRENKKFDFMLYPEARHGIGFRRYGEARLEYFIEHLKPTAARSRVF